MKIRRVPGTPLDGLLVYSEAEYSFRFDVASPVDLRDSAGAEGLASVEIGTLQIEVGVSTHRALFVWGLHPRVRWHDGSLPDLTRSTGAIVLDPETEYQAGASILLAPVGQWSTVYDPDSGWLRVAENAEDDELTEIANGVVLGSAGGELTSVWLSPAFDK